MQEYFQLGEFRVFGAPIQVHWTVIATISVILLIYRQNPVNVVLAMLSFFSIILVHEIGHAILAHRLGYRVFELKICPFHGLCEYEAAYSEWDDVRIAWGGVLAQMLLAMLVFIAAGLGAGRLSYFGPILVFLGYYSLLVVPYNLLPIRGLDGGKAWRIIPLFYQRVKHQRR